MPQIVITAGDVTLRAKLDDTPTARLVWDALPIDGRANVWGDEIYFGIPVEADLEPDARAEVAVGELAYWPAGRAFCVFFGPTPASVGEEPKAASPVNILGRVLGDATRLRGVEQGASVRIIRDAVAG
jgi:hypothetical protein